MIMVVNFRKQVTLIGSLVSQFCWLQENYLLICRMYIDHLAKILSTLFALTADKNFKLK